MDRLATPTAPPLACGRTLPGTHGPEKLPCPRAVWSRVPLPSCRLSFVVSAAAAKDSGSREQKSQVTVRDLVEKFGISAGTARADLDALFSQSMVVRSHGG